MASYLQELSYCRSASVDLRSASLLAWQTVRFHAQNLFNASLVGGGVFTTKLHLAPGYTKQIHMRPYGGDIFVLYEVLMHGFYFLPEDTFAGEVQTIIDCGANIGITSLYFASRYPRARIISVEPHPENFSILSKNVSSEPRIIPVHGAVVGQPRPTVRFSTNQAAWGNSLTDGTSGVEVPAWTIGQLCEKYGLTDLDLLKVDIEGAEKEVFASGDFLDRHRVKFGMIELHHPYSYADFTADLARFGFLPEEPGTRGARMITFQRSHALNMAAQRH